MKVGNKPNNPGYVWMPYIISHKTPTISESSLFDPKI